MAPLLASHVLGGDDSDLGVLVPKREGDVQQLPSIIGMRPNA